MADFITSFRAFIEKIVKFFQDLVAQIRKNNDEGWPSVDESDPVA